MRVRRFNVGEKLRVTFLAAPASLHPLVRSARRYARLCCRDFEEVTSLQRVDDGLARFGSELHESSTGSLPVSAAHRSSAIAT